MKKLIIFMFFVFGLQSVLLAQHNPFSFIKKKEDKKTQIKEIEGGYNYLDIYNFKSSFYHGINQKSLGNYNKALSAFLECIKIIPEESSPYFEAAKILFFQQEYSESLIYAKKAVDLDPNNKWYSEFYAKELYNQQEFSKAIKIYKKLLKQHPDNHEYYIQLIDNYIFSSRLQEAIRVCNDLEKIIGKNRYSSIQKHKIYLELNSPKLAVKELKELIKEFPSEKEAHVLLSDYYLLNDQFEEALQILNQLILIDPNSESIRLTISDLYLQKGEILKCVQEMNKAFLSEKINIQAKINSLAKFLELLEKEKQLINEAEDLCDLLIKTHDEDPIAHYFCAEFFREIDSKRKALIEYQNTIELDPNIQEAWINLLFLSMELKEKEILSEKSNEAISFFPTNPIFYYIRGVFLYDQENFNELIRILNIGVEFSSHNKPLSAEMYGLLGNAYNSINEFSNSDESFEKSLIFSPNNVQVLNNYSYFLALREENLDKALGMSKKTIDLYPGTGAYCDTYGWILYKMGRYLESKKWITLAIEKTKNQSVVMMEHMGDVCYKLEDFDEALLYWGKALELGGNSKLLQEKMDLCKIKSNE